MRCQEGELLKEGSWVRGVVKKEGEKFDEELGKGRVVGGGGEEKEAATVDVLGDVIYLSVGLSNFLDFLKPAEFSLYSNDDSSFTGGSWEGEKWSFGGEGERREWFNVGGGGEGDCGGGDDRDVGGGGDGGCGEIGQVDWVEFGDGRGGDGRDVGGPSPPKSLKNS